MLFARFAIFVVDGGEPRQYRGEVGGSRQADRQPASRRNFGRPKGRKMLKRVREVEAQVGDSRRGSGRNGVIALCLCGGRAAE